MSHELCVMCHLNFLSWQSGLVDLGCVSTRPRTSQVMNYIYILIPTLTKCTDCTQVRDHGPGEGLGPIQAATGELGVADSASSFLSSSNWENIFTIVICWFSVPNKLLYCTSVFIFVVVLSQLSQCSWSSRVKHPSEQYSLFPKLFFTFLNVLHLRENNNDTSWFVNA